MESKTQVGIRRPGSPYSDQECEEIIDKLELLLDGELDTEKEQEFVEMVNNCEYCLEQYKIEKSLRQLIKNGFNQMFVNNSLVDSIRNKIRSVKSEQSGN